MKRTVPVALSLVVLFLASPFAQAKVVEIENSQIKVAVSTDPVGFEIVDLQSGKTFVKNEAFAAAIESLRKQDVSDAIWGDGKEIVATWKQGGKTSFRLFGDSPFTQIRTTFGAPERGQPAHHVAARAARATVGGLATTPYEQHDDHGDKAQ